MRFLCVLLYFSSILLGHNTVVSPPTGPIYLSSLLNKLSKLGYSILLTPCKSLEPMVDLILPPQTSSSRGLYFLNCLPAADFHVPAA